MSFFVQTSAPMPPTVQRKQGDFLLQAEGLGVQASEHVQLDDDGGGNDNKAKVAKGGDEAAASGGASTTNGATANSGGGGGDSEDGPMVQKKSDGSGRSDQVSLSSYLEQTASGGSKMDANTNARMSGAFGQDFSNVQLHTDGGASRVCRSIGANAFATGNHVYFAGGKYSPGSASGDHLLAHELTHTVQQSGGVVGRSIAKKGVTLGSPGDAYEVEADNVATAVVSALHSGRSGATDVAKDDDGTGIGSSLPTVSLAQAIIQRKVSGVPDVQMDIGVTLGIIGVAVSAGAWLATTGSNTMSLQPNMNWIGARNEDRVRWRKDHPWRKATVGIIQKQTLGTGEYYGCNLTYQYNGAEIIDCQLDHYYWMTSGEDSHTEAAILENQSDLGKLGVRASATYDPWGPANYVRGEGTGWISVDGSYNVSRPAWTRG